MSGYELYITPDALREIKDLPGHIRQRVKRAVNGLIKNPYPPGSISLDFSAVACSVHRIRLEKWRIDYAVNEAEKIVDVMGVRKRPPYDYGDVEKLLAEL